MNTTISYYNQNAKDFIANTKNADMTPLYEKFITYLPTNSMLLDCGCGSGRDTKYFIQHGYNVTALDASQVLCQMAHEITGHKILCMTFSQIQWENKFDGVWACASLLHLSKQELPDIFYKIAKALKIGGYLYCSFKYGNYEGERNGRYFTDLTEKTLRDATIISRLKTIEQWQTEDVRPERKEKWLNTILKKVD